jgi:hypothetical protein
MALAILDGTQTATTLSTILSSGQHITAHTVVSLGTQAITDMRSAVSGSVLSVSNFPAIQPISGSVTIGNSVTIGSLPAIFADPSGFASVVAGISDVEVNTIRSVLWIPIENGSDGEMLSQANPLPISGTVNVTALPAGTNRIGVVTIGGGTVTIGAGISQIGSVTASISGTVPISISSVTVGNSVTIGSLPAISGTVTANTFAVQGTAVTTSNFTSTTASTVLASFNATREVLTIFNEGAGNLHIAPGATCTTIAYQVRLSAGDYYEVPNHQTTITHSAVFATAGTARVTQIS